MKRYFEYLCNEIRAGGQFGHSYFHLCKLMFETPFFAMINGDKNREYEGMRLREGFSDAPNGECSVFEALVGLCRSVIFMAEGIVPDDENTEPEWFKLFIMNLGLAGLDDRMWDDNPDDFVEIANDRIDKWLNREYEFDGTGGLFPIKNPKNDQSRVEIWYQLNSYLLEKMKDF